MTSAIVFITGTSGSGKSTLVSYLKKQLPHDNIIYDFDEEGVPADANKNWREEKTTYWLDKAKQNFSQNLTTIICGQTVPSEIQNLSNYSKKIPIYYGIITCSDEEIRRRLIKRNWDKQLIEDNVNWAKHLKKEVEAQEHHYIMDNTVLNTIQSGEKVARWISQTAH